MDIATIKNKIKEEMIDELKYGDSDLICCEDFLNELDELPTEEEEGKITNIFYEEWRNYVNKIEEFLKTID